MALTYILRRGKAKGGVVSELAKPLAFEDRDDNEGAYSMAEAEADLAARAGEPGDLLTDGSVLTDEGMMATAAFADNEEE